jgi:hypothetical protein
MNGSELDRDLSEIEFRVSCLTDSQRQQLLAMLRNPALPDLSAIEEEITRLRACLEEIANHEHINTVNHCGYPIDSKFWSHALKELEISSMINGMRKGHRCAAAIAKRGLKEK